MLCVDEKSQIQALDRPPRSCRCSRACPNARRATHDYTRSGTSSLYAALDITSGQVIGRLHRRRRAIEFKQFLATLDREVPAELDVHAPQAVNAAVVHHVRGGPLPRMTARVALIGDDLGGRTSRGFPHTAPLGFPGIWEP